jgi:hypothetical protein
VGVQVRLGGGVRVVVEGGRDQALGDERAAAGAATAHHQPGFEVGDHVVDGRHVRGPDARSIGGAGRGQQ